MDTRAVLEDIKTEVDNLFWMPDTERIDHLTGLIIRLVGVVQEIDQRTSGGNK